jgi:hypothetical protein
VRARLVVLATLACLLLAPVTAVHAQDAALAAQIEEGVTLRERGDDEGAAAVFRAAYDRTGSNHALAQLALAEQALGRWALAFVHLTAALRSDDPWVAQRRAPLEQALATIRTRVGQLDIRGGVDGARLLLNGEPSGVFPFREPVPVEAGSVVMRVEAPGHHPFERVVVVPAGGIARERIQLVAIEGLAVTSSSGGDPSATGEPSGATTPATRSASGGDGGAAVAGWVVFGTGLAALATGGVFLGLGQAAASNVENAPRGTPITAVAEDLDRADWMRVTGWVLAGVGLAASAAGLVLALAAPGSSGESVTLQLRPNGVSLAWRTP